MRRSDFLNEYRSWGFYPYVWLPLPLLIPGLVVETELEKLSYLFVVGLVLLVPLRIAFLHQADPLVSWVILGIVVRLSTCYPYELGSLIVTTVPLHRDTTPCGEEIWRFSESYQKTPRSLGLCIEGRWFRRRGRSFSTRRQSRK